MGSSRVLISMAIVALLVVVLATFLTARSPYDGADNGAMLPDLAARINTVASIRVRSDGHLVTVVRDDGQWRVEEQSGYAADETLVRSLLLDLAQVMILDHLTARPELHFSLGVSDLSQAGSRAIGIELADVNNASLASMVLGDSQRETERFARLAGRPQVLLVSALPAIPVVSSDWLERSVLDIGRLDIARIDINDLNGERIALEAGDSGEMTLVNLSPGAVVRYQYALNDFASTLAGLEFESVRPATDFEFSGALSGTLRSHSGFLIRFASARVHDQTWLEFNLSTTADASGQSVLNADRLNRKLSGWAYRLSDAAMSRLARPMDELIKFDLKSNHDS